MSTTQTENDVVRAINHLGMPKVAKMCAVTQQAVRKWREKGRLPRTEFSGETDYAQTIADEVGGCLTPNITKESLLQATREKL